MNPIDSPQICFPKEEKQILLKSFIPQFFEQIQKNQEASIANMNCDEILVFVECGIVGHNKELEMANFHRANISVFYQKNLKLFQNQLSLINFLAKIVSSDWMERDSFFQYPKMGHSCGFQGIRKEKTSCESIFIDLSEALHSLLQDSLSIQSELTKNKESTGINTEISMEVKDEF